MTLSHMDSRRGWSKHVIDEQPQHLHNVCTLSIAIAIINTTPQDPKQNLAKPISHTMSLSPGYDTFTVDRLRQVWREGRQEYGTHHT